MKNFSMLLAFAAILFSPYSHASTANPDAVFCTDGKTKFTNFCVSTCHTSSWDGKFDNAAGCTACRGGVMLISAGYSLKDAASACGSGSVASLCVSGAASAALACGQK